MKNIITVLSVIAAAAMALYSCSDKADNSITVLTDEVKTGAVSVKGDTVCTFPDTVLADMAWMTGDRYAVCRTQTGWTGLSANQWAFQVYDTRTMQRVSCFLHAGNGPYEVLQPSAYVVDDTLYVKDLQKSKLFIVPLDRADEGLQDHRWIKEMPFSFMTMRTVTYKGRMLSLNPYWFEDKSINVSNGEPKLFYSDGELIPYDESKIFSGNCFQGHLLTNPDKGTIVYVENSYPLVEFYDDSLRLVRSIIGPDKTKPEYLNAGNSLFHAKYYGSIYGCVCCDDRYIYLNYNDELSSEPFMTTELVDGSPVISVNDDTDDSEKETEPKDVLILVLDWKGNLQSSYRLEGLKGCTAISSGRDGTLYASVKDTETDQLSILGYKLF